MIVSIVTARSEGLSQWTRHVIYLNTNKNRQFVH